MQVNFPAYQKIKFGSGITIDTGNPITPSGDPFSNKSAFGVSLFETTQILAERVD